MSLLATATEWKQDEQPRGTKKRSSTLGGARQMPPLPHLEENRSLSAEDNTTTSNFEGMDEHNTRTNQRVSQILNKMSTIDAFSDGDGLVDYRPRPSMVATQTSIHPARVDAMTTMAERVADVTPPLPKPVQLRQLPQPDYMPNQPSMYSNYHTVHNPVIPRIVANGERPNMLASSNDRIMEKLNYLIHLMEEQQMEKTNNVMEEFILYCLLGVFMIYTVDSFTRVGKYSR